jgi:ParB-like chromosome segregation protein Spo0J
MPTTHRYQVMPDLPHKDYAALKADINEHGVKNSIQVDEDDNTLDGHQRRRICEELGIECPKMVIHGLTDTQKREYAWRMNLMRRHLTRPQKREIAGTLWQKEEWTQDRIAEALGVSQRTVSRWLEEFSHSAELPRPDTVLGKDGKRYPTKKKPRRTAQPTERANISNNPIRSDANGRPAQALEQQATPQPRDTHAEAQSAGTAPAVPLDISAAPEGPPWSAMSCGQRRGVSRAQHWGQAQCHRRKAMPKHTG